MEKLQRCQFAVPRKNRTCKMLVKVGQKFCGEHSAAGSERTAKRMPCPLDPKHTVDESNLQKHLTKCNSRLLKDPLDVWICENFNALPSQDVHFENFEIEDLDIKKVDPALLRQTINQINVVFGRIEHALVEDAKFDEFFEIHANISGISTRRRKHLLQQSSIIAHMEDANMVNDDTCFIEFGAGRAELAYWLAVKLYASLSTGHEFLLIDRSGVRYKFENKLTKGILFDREDNEHNTENVAKVSFDRLRCGIEHVNLKLVPILRKNPDRRVVAMCKHLCGVAIDFAMNALLNAVSQPDGIKLAGAVLAPCCHHRCLPAHFFGRSIFVEFGFRPEQFKLLTQMSSWATCGFKKEQAATNIQHVPESSATSRQQSSDFGFDRETVGRKCKAIFDYCRGKTFEKHGFSVRYKYFVPRHVTPENLILILEPKF